MTYKDPDKQREAVCLHCGKGLELVPGKVPKRFCSDTHRKAYKRAELKEFEAVAGSSVAEPRTDGTKQPRTATPDKRSSYTILNDGPINIETSPKRGKALPKQVTKAIPKFDYIGLGPKAKPQSHNPMMVGYVPPKN